VDDTMGVRVIKARGDPTQVPEGGLLVEHLLAHLSGQAAARDVLDDHVGGALELAEVVDVDDVRVAEPGDRLRLVAEAGDGVRVGRDGLHDLDRPGPLELRVVRPVDHPHGALPDEVLDLVLPQPGPGRYRHGC